MQSVLRRYDCIILDFSAMFAELDSDLIGALNEAMNIYVASTFDCECRQVEKAVPYRIASRYKENKQNINAKGLKVCRLYGTLDTFGLANCLSGNSNYVLVIEANYLLEDRIVLSNTYVDVYSLLEKRLIKCEDFPGEAASRTIDKGKTPLTYYEVAPGDYVYTEKGKYSLAGLLEGGAEAQIFKVNNNPQILAKIYKEDEDGNFVLTSQKLNNINILKEINDNWDVLWLALPIDVIYIDSARTKPVGYMMKYFDETEFLSNNSLFNGGDINAKFPEHDEVTVKDVLEICIKFVRQILFLALNDIYISDYNDKNFAVSIKSDSKILMVDTDSYCCEGYVSECITYSGCLSKKYECNTRLDLLNICDESLFVFIFTRFMLDSGFVPMRKSEFRFSAEKVKKLDNPNLKAKWNSIPKNLQNLFINIFEKKQSSSISILLFELEAAYSQEFADTKYREIYREVLGTTKAQSKAQTDGSHMANQLPPQSTSQRTTSSALPRKRKVWKWVAGGVAAVLVALALLWFRSVSQLQRYESEDGYYLSYNPELDGYIEFYWDNGNSYKGDYSDGAMTGCGEYKWANGDSYSGDFVDGQMTGNGTYNYSDGTKYTGAFLDGYRDGQGTLYDANGNEVYVGSWKEGFFSGEGKYYFPNGTRFQSTWENGTCHEGETVSLKNTNSNEPGAKGYWDANVFYGSYYENGQWYELP